MMVLTWTVSKKTSEHVLGTHNNIIAVHIIDESDIPLMFPDRTQYGAC